MFIIFTYLVDAFTQSDTFFEKVQSDSPRRNWGRGGGIWKLQKSGRNRQTVLDPGPLGPERGSSDIQYGNTKDKPWTCCISKAPCSMGFGAIMAAGLAPPRLTTRAGGGGGGTGTATGLLVLDKNKETQCALTTNLNFEIISELVWFSHRIILFLCTAYVGIM